MGEQPKPLRHPTLRAVTGYPFDLNRVHGPASRATAEGWLAIRCGNCGREVSGAIAAADWISPGSQRLVTWLQCPTCLFGTVIQPNGLQYPAAMPGSDVDGLPDEIERAWYEARSAAGAHAPAAAILMCRKILAHVAVDKGADTGKSFASYIDYLIERQLVTPAMKSWVDQIRTQANESTHQLVAHSDDDAENVLAFTEQLLVLTYQMAHLAARYTSPSR